MDIDFEYGRKLGFKTVGIFRAFREKEPRLYELLMRQKEKYDEATIYLSKQILTANKCYPALWFEINTVGREVPIKEERLSGSPLRHE